MYGDVINNPSMNKEERLDSGYSFDTKLELGYTMRCESRHRRKIISAAKWYISTEEARFL